MNDTRRTQPMPDSPSNVNNSVVITTSAGEPNNTVTQCKHEHQTRIGNSALVKCMACGKCRHDRSLERNR